MIMGKVQTNNALNTRFISDNNLGLAWSNKESFGEEN